MCLLGWNNFEIQIQFEIENSVLTISSLAWYFKAILGAYSKWGTVKSLFHLYELQPLSAEFSQAQKKQTATTKTLAYFTRHNRLHPKGYNGDLVKLKKACLFGKNEFEIQNLL